jgi:hypothetical protein
VVKVAAEVEEEEKVVEEAAVAAAQTNLNNLFQPQPMFEPLGHHPPFSMATG